MASYQKILDLALGLTALLIWFILRQTLLFFANMLHISMWGAFSPVDVLALVVAGGMFWWMRRNTTIRTFGIEAITELSKVTWPTRKETVLSTGVVLIMVTFVTMIIFFFDLGLGFLAQKFLEF